MQMQFNNMQMQFNNMQMQFNKKLEAKDEELEASDKKLEASDKKLEAYDKKLEAQSNELKQFPTLRELAASNLVVHNETASSAHTHTNHMPASTKVRPAPLIVLAEEFWDRRSRFRPPTSVDSEADVNFHICILLNEVIDALGLRNVVEPAMNVPMMDTAPDIGLKIVANKLLAATIEGKKTPQNSS
jgi:hypothetical protein